MRFVLPNKKGTALGNGIHPLLFLHYIVYKFFGLLVLNCFRIFFFSISRSCELSLNLEYSFLCFWLFKISKYFSKPITVLNVLYVLSFLPCPHFFKQSNKLLLKFVIRLDLISLFSSLVRSFFFNITVTSETQLKCPFESSKMSILYAFLAYRQSYILCDLIAYFIMLICLQS